MGVSICTSTLLADPMRASAEEVRAAGEAALAAGAAGLSIWAHHLPALQGIELPVTVVEAAFGWANGEPASAASEARRLATVVAETGATKLVAVCMDAQIVDLGRARDHLATLVAIAGDAGAQVCVEFLPWTAIPDLATAWSLVEPLGDDAGILLDTWHWVRQPGGPALELLGSIPGNRIGYLQLCDAAAEPGPDSMTEAMTARLLPGQGIVDFAGVLAALATIGAEPVVATEVFNPAAVAADGPAATAVATIASVRAIGIESR